MLQNQRMGLYQIAQRRTYGEEELKDVHTGDPVVFQVENVEEEFAKHLYLHSNCEHLKGFGW